MSSRRTHLKIQSLRRIAHPEPKATYPSYDHKRHLSTQCQTKDETCDIIHQDVYRDM